MARTQGAKDTKPRQSKPTGEVRGIAKDQNPELEEGYNTKRIRFMQVILPTEPLDYNDVDEMERRFVRYLNLCAEWDMKIGNQAAYAAIGIDKGLVWDWLNRREANPRRTDFLKKVQTICAMYREGLMEDGKVNPVTGIFWQKNYDGMKDQQEVVLTPNTNPLGEQPNMEALKQKYLDTTYGITPELPESAEEVQKEPQKAQKGRRKPAAAVEVKPTQD